MKELSSKKYKWHIQTPKCRKYQANEGLNSKMLQVSRRNLLTQKNKEENTQKTW